MAKAGIGRDEVAYIGDDMTDIVVMRRVGFAIATATRGRSETAAHLVTQSPGGQGALREVAELILKARGTGRHSAQVRSGGLSVRRKTGFFIHADAGPSPSSAHGVIARHGGDITRSRSSRACHAFEDLLRNRTARRRGIAGGGSPRAVGVSEVSVVDTFQRIYGKRIIIMAEARRWGKLHRRNLRSRPP